MNDLAEKNPELLDIFQHYAKKAADEGTVNITFMSNEACVLRRMRGNRSSWSRCGRIIEIGDVSKEEALQYLKLRKIDEKQAAQIYEIVGGRMIDLKSIADDIKANCTLEGMCMIYYAKLVSFSPPLQLHARRYSPKPKVNSSPLKFFVGVVITRTEPRLYVNF